jgi:hypothetical protein
MEPDAGCELIGYLIQDTRIPVVLPMHEIDLDGRRDTAKGLQHTGHMTVQPGIEKEYPQIHA